MFAPNNNLCLTNIFNYNYNKRGNNETI